MPTYQTPDGLLVADRTDPKATASKTTSKTTLPVTERLMDILKAVYDASLNHATDADRWYVLDASRERLQTIDVLRVSMIIRRLPRGAAVRIDWQHYLRALVENPEPALDFSRAMLRNAIEVSEAVVATERFRYRRTRKNGQDAIRENTEAIAALHETNRSIAAECALLPA